MTNGAGVSSRRLGVDVGGTKCLGVVIDDAGFVIAERRSLTPRGDGSASQVIDAIGEVTQQLIHDVGAVDSIGVGVPGLVTTTGVLRAAPNLDGVSDLAVADLLADRLGYPVAVDNDATCALVAEWRQGAGRGVDDLVLVTLGTGIGGGIVSGGRVHRGVNGFAGEFGHMTVDPNGPICPCGRRGCWERYASGSGLADLARQEGSGSVGAMAAPAILEAAQNGDAAASAVVDRFADWVAIGLAALTNAIDPARIVIGGGMASSAAVFLDPVRDRLEVHLYGSANRTIPDVVVAELGERAGAIGAALLGEPIGR